MNSESNSLRSLIKQWLDPLKQRFVSEQDTIHTVPKQLACAALLIEVMKMDGNMDIAEEQVLTQRLIHHFKLAPDEISQLTSEANLELDESTDYHQFTQALNQQLSIDEKIALVESLWLMAAADGQIDAHENHLIRKIADLLHLRHSEFVAIKDKVLKSQK